jgi:shikimate dehydrogenase
MAVVHGSTAVAGVWGWPVRHSASPAMHNAAFAELGLDWVYVPFAVDPQGIDAAVAGVRALGIRGVNVTVPLKELVGVHLDDLTPVARRLGAVNTLYWDSGRLVGDSTDGPGFLSALGHAGLREISGKTVVVLGAGGSARAVVDALAGAGARVLVANRTREKALPLLELGAADIVDWSEDVIGDAVSRSGLLVNTTSVGMVPDVEGMPPVPAGCLTAGLVVVDLIYNPPSTRLLNAARDAGCVVQNGVEMLVRQGALSFERWTGVPAPVDAMRAAVLAELASRTH